MFGGIFNIKSSSDYSVYIDAVNADASGNAIEDGVRIGYYDPMQTDMKKMKAQQSSWQLSAKFGDFFKFRLGDIYGDGVRQLQIKDIGTGTASEQTY